LVLRFRKAVDEGRHCRTSRVGGSQSTTGVTAHGSRSDEPDSAGPELVDTAFSRGFEGPDTTGLQESGRHV